VVPKHFEGPDNIVDLINAGEVDMIINTPYGNPGPRVDGYEIRTAAVLRDIPCITTVQGAAAAVQGIEALIRGDITVRPLQALHTALRAACTTPHSAGPAGLPGVQ
jgi:carbamoyl-phosphate synthase large subunit